MTTHFSKPVRRVMPVAIRDGGKARLLVVTLHGNMIELRLSGRRQSEFVDLESAFFGAIKARTFKARMDRAKEKAQRRRARS